MRGSRTGARPTDGRAGGLTVDREMIGETYDPRMSDGPGFRTFARLGEAIASAIRIGRRTLGWSQRRLAGEAGLSQSTVSRLERGRATGIPLEAIDATLEVLGISLRISVGGQALTAPRQHDGAHAPSVGYAGRRLAADDWIVELEAEVGDAHRRGWIDILGYRPDARTLLVTEIKTESDDVGATQRQLGWYEGQAWAAARARGWRVDRLVVVLILLMTEWNEELVARNSTLLRQWLPTRATRLQRAVDDPGALEYRITRGLAMVDPRSRRRAWLRPTRVDGRRTPAPYADYATFMQALERDLQARRRSASRRRARERAA